MAVTVGNVLIKPKHNPKKESKIMSYAQRQNKEEFFQGVVVEVGGPDGIYPLDENIVPGAEVLVPKIQKQFFEVYGAGHFICHYSEIKYIYPKKKEEEDDNG